MPLSARAVTSVLLVTIVGLTLASIAGQVCQHILGEPRLFGLVPAFDLDNEANIPTWYQSSTLFLCALLLAALAVTQRRLGQGYVKHWAGLSVIFLGLSADEVISLHEFTIPPLRALLHAGGVFHFTWVVLGIVFVLLLGLAYRKFLHALPLSIRRLFLIAAILFIFGSIGLELIEGYYLTHISPEEDFIYAMVTTVEEFCEMAGVVVFLHALLSLLGNTGAVLKGTA